MSLRLALPLVLVSGFAACHSGGSAQLRVVGVQQSARPDSVLVHVQVVNRTEKPMRLQRLEYTFAGAGHQVSLAARQIEPGAAAVVEVQLDDPPAGGAMLRGKLFAELDEIVRSFPVTAKVTEPLY